MNQIGTRFKCVYKILIILRHIMQLKQINLGEVHVTTVIADDLEYNNPANSLDLASADFSSHTLSIVT